MKKFFIKSWTNHYFVGWMGAVTCIGLLTYLQQNAVISIPIVMIIYVVGYSLSKKFGCNLGEE